MTSTGRPRLEAVGAADGLPRDHCRVVGSGTGVVVMTDVGPRAFVNRCPHNGLPLDGAWVRDGVLTCPHHFWRFEVATGSGLTDGDDLTSLELREVAGSFHVVLPGGPTEESFRERQLRHARTWRRDRP